ncbi:hypothetical protein ACJJTC_012110 [Scirpophaga incertulas]
MYWDQDTILEFIELLKNEPVIWNHKSKNHNNKNAVNEAWQRVASSFSLDLSIDELKRKRNSVTTLYRSLVKKIHESTRNGDGEDLYQPTWYAFDLMHSFMAPLYGFEDDGTIRIEAVNSLSLETQSHETDEDSEYDSSKGARKEFVRPSVKRKHASRDRDPLTVTKPEEATLDQNYQFIPPEQDETDLFAQILVHKLKKMSRQDRLMATHEINNVVFKYEMKALETSSVGTSKEIKSDIL